MKYDIFNKEGKKVGDTQLPKEIFEVKVKPDLVYQVVRSQSSNRRRTVAHVKDRGEVSGGGRKPWRQKGLGRARHGSIRSPIWIGGGVTFGPTKDKSFKKKIPKKMRKSALFMVLSAKADKNLIILLDDIKIESHKTKLMAGVLKKLPFKRASSLIALPDLNKNVILSSRNIPKVKTMQAKDLNCLDLLSFKYLVMPVESISVIEKTFLKQRADNKEQGTENPSMRLRTGKKQRRESKGEEKKEAKEPKKTKETKKKKVAKRTKKKIVSKRRKEKNPSKRGTRNPSTSSGQAKNKR